MLMMMLLLVCLLSFLLIVCGGKKGLLKEEEVIVILLSFCPQSLVFVRCLGPSDSGERFSRKGRRNIDPDLL